MSFSLTAAASCAAGGGSPSRAAVAGAHRRGGGADLRGLHDFEKRWSWPRALPLYLTSLTLTPWGSLTAPLKAPVHSLLDGIAESRPRSLQSKPLLHFS